MKGIAFDLQTGLRMGASCYDIGQTGNGFPHRKKPLLMWRSEYGAVTDNPVKANEWRDMGLFVREIEYS